MALACCHWSQLFNKTECCGGLFNVSQQCVRVEADHFFALPLINQLQRFHDRRQLVDGIDPCGLLYPATYLPAQSDSIIKEIILTLALTLTHSSIVRLVIDPALVTLTQETGDIRYLRRALNLSDLADTGEARENLELRNLATRDVGTEAGTVAAGMTRSSLAPFRTK